MQRGDVLDPDANRRSGRGVAVMFAEVQQTAVARYFDVEWRVLAEAVFPLDLETEKADIEFLRLLDIECVGSALRLRASA